MKKSILPFLFLAITATGCKKEPVEVKKEPEKVKEPIVHISRNIENVLVGHPVTFTASVENANYISWDFGYEELNDGNSLTRVFNEGGITETYRVHAYYKQNGLTKKKTFKQSLRIYVPGCMDKEAINYDPKADMDIGDCIFGGKLTIYKDAISRSGGGNQFCNNSKDEVFIRVWNDDGEIAEGSFNGKAEYPSCDGPNTFTIKLLPGKYYVSAESNYCSKSYACQVEYGKCTLVGIIF